MKWGVAVSFQISFDNEVDGATEFPNLNIILVNKTKVFRYIWVDGFYLHVRGCGNGEIFVPHKLSWECAQLVKVQPMESSQEIFITAEVCIHVVNADFLNSAFLTAPVPAVGIFMML